jgi:hypothetical protein
MPTGMPAPLAGHFRRDPDLALVEPVRGTPAVGWSPGPCENSANRMRVRLRSGREATGESRDSGDGGGWGSACGEGGGGRMLEGARAIFTPCRLMSRKEAFPVSGMSSVREAVGCRIPSGRVLQDPVVDLRPFPKGMGSMAGPFPYLHCLPAIENGSRRVRTRQSRGEKESQGSESHARSIFMRWFPAVSRPRGASDGNSRKGLIALQRAAGGAITSTSFSQHISCSWCDSKKESLYFRILSIPK